MMDEQRPLVHAGPTAVPSRSVGWSQPPGRLARTVVIERTYVPERAARLVASSGTDPLDRFERALVYATHEASNLKQTKEGRP
jgi:hypothetical protein